MSYDTSILIQSGRHAGGELVTGEAMTTTRPEPPPPTHPGLAYLRARAAYLNAPDNGRLYWANNDALEGWEAAGYPTDLVPQADLGRPAAEVAGYQSDLLEREQEAKQARRDRDTSNAALRDAVAGMIRAEEDAKRLAARVAACDAEILRLEAENRRLTRGLRGWVRAWLGRR